MNPHLGGKIRVNISKAINLKMLLWIIRVIWPIDYDKIHYVLQICCSCLISCLRWSLSEPILADVRDPRGRVAFC